MHSSCPVLATAARVCVNPYPLHEQALDAAQPSMLELFRHPGYMATILVPTNDAWDAALAAYGEHFTTTSGYSPTPIRCMLHCHISVGALFHLHVGLEMCSVIMRIGKALAGPSTAESTVPSTDILLGCLLCREPPTGPSCAPAGAQVPHTPTRASATVSACQDWMLRLLHSTPGPQWLSSSSACQEYSAWLRAS